MKRNETAARDADLFAAIDQQVSHLVETVYPRMQLSDREQLGQYCLIQVWRCLADYMGAENRKAWLMRVLRRSCHRLFVRESHAKDRERLVDPADLDNAFCTRPEPTGLLLADMLGLTCHDAIDYKIATLHVLEERSLRNVATLLNLNESSLRKRLKRMGRRWICVRARTEREQSAGRARGERGAGPPALKTGRFWAARPRSKGHITQRSGRTNVPLFAEPCEAFDKSLCKGSPGSTGLTKLREQDQVHYTGVSE